MNIKETSLSVLISHITHTYGWSKGLGHYVYYRENMKKPTKKNIKTYNIDYIKNIVSKINKGSENDIFNINKNKPKHKKQIKK